MTHTAPTITELAVETLAAHLRDSTPLPRPSRGNGYYTVAPFGPDRVISVHTVSYYYFGDPLILLNLDRGVIFAVATKKRRDGERSPYGTALRYRGSDRFPILPQEMNDEIAQWLTSGVESEQALTDLWNLVAQSPALLGEQSAAEVFGRTEVALFLDEQGRMGVGDMAERYPGQWTRSMVTDLTGCDLAETWVYLA